MPEKLLENGIKLLQEFGMARGLFAAFFFGAHYWVYHLYNKRVDDAKEQIKRIAEENREYRERFLRMLDNKHGYESKFLGPPEITSADAENGGNA